MDTRLTVMLLTWERTGYALKTLEALFKNFRYSGPVHLHIADDGSREDHRNALRNRVAEISETSVSVSNSEGRGYGANYNAATLAIHDSSDVVLVLEDDWEMTRDFQFDELVESLMTTNKFGCLRLGYIGYTQQLRSEFVWHNEQHFLLLDPNSPEPHVFSGHPRLETVAWQRQAGLWPEGLAPGETEFAVAHRLENRRGVAWPIDQIKPRGDLFSHVGTVKAIDWPQEVSV